MGRKQKLGFFKPKMMASRVEESDFIKFENLVSHRDGKKLQDFLNLVVTEYISGNLYLSGSSFCVKSGVPE